MRASCLVLLAIVAGPAVATDPALFVQPAGPPKFVAACPTCGPREASSFGAAVPNPPATTLHKLLYPFTIGEGCRMPVGCSSYFAERTFLWGSCRQFYTPGNKCVAHPGSYCGGQNLLVGMNGYNGGFFSAGGCPGGNCQ